MIEVNNFKEIIPYLKFEPDYKSVILVWVVKRNKDGNTESKGNNKNRTIKSYHFQSLEQLESKQEEIISLCKEFNCRAYIGVNAKPILNVLFTLQGLTIEHIKEVINNPTSGVSLKGILDSAVMKSGSSGDKLWVIDIDTKDEDFINQVTIAINNASSGFSTNVLCQLSTAHGVHLLTHPFDVRFLTPFGTDVEIKKEGLTLLYAYLND